MDNSMDRRTALIMIDMQRGFISKGSALCIAGAEATIPACAALAESCRERGIPVFFVNRSYRADGSDVEHTRRDVWLRGGRALSPGCPEDISGDMPAELGFCAKDYLLIKPRFSAFFGTELDLMLRRLRVDSLLVAGATSPNCIRATCYDGISLEYNVAIVSDCTSSVNDEIQLSNLRDMANAGAQIISSADFISGAAVLEDSVGRAHEAVMKERAGLI